jgi:hypothetical protein
MLAVALVAGALAYSATRYGPHLVDARRVRALVSEAGQRAASFETDRAARSWFDQRAQDEGFGWLSSKDLYWQRVDRHTVHVGVGWSVDVQHLVVGTQRLDFRWYCTATEATCVEFEPTFE